MRHTRSNLAFSSFVLCLSTVLGKSLTTEDPALQAPLKEIRDEFERVVRDECVPTVSEIVYKGGCLVSHAAALSFERGRSFEEVTTAEFWMKVFAIVRGRYEPRRGRAGDTRRDLDSESVLLCCALDLETANGKFYRAVEQYPNVSEQALSVSPSTLGDIVD